MTSLNLFAKENKSSSSAIQTLSTLSTPSPRSISSNISAKSISPPAKSPSYSNSISEDNEYDTDSDNNSTTQSSQPDNNKPIPLDYEALNCDNDYSWSSSEENKQKSISPQPEYWWPQQSDSEDEFYNLNESQINDKLNAKMASLTTKMEHSNKLISQNTYTKRDNKSFAPIHDELIEHIQGDHYGHKKNESIIIHHTLDDIQDAFLSDIGHYPHTMQQLLNYCKQHKFKYKYINIKKWWSTRPHQASKPMEKAINADEYCKDN